MTDTEKAEGNHIAVLEAILFMHGAPVKVSRIAEIMDVDAHAVEGLVGELRTVYEERESGLTIITEGDRVQMTTASVQAQVIERFTQRELEGDLSQAALEVLAVIAYRGPLAKPDIEAIRGVNCSFTLRNLLMRGLVERTAHPTDKRTKLYRITADCVRVLGLSDVSELPHFDVLTNDKRIDAILMSDSGQDEEELES